MSRILIVEDDKDIALALGTRLRAAGFTVAHAYDAIAGVTQARREAPDLVLLDLMMPAGGGLKVADRLRALETTSSVPIIFLTASKDPAMRAKALAHHPHDFIEKPYDPVALLASINRALGVVA